MYSAPARSRKHHRFDKGIYLRSSCHTIQKDIYLCTGKEKTFNSFDIEQLRRIINKFIKRYFKKIKLAMAQTDRQQKKQYIRH